MSLSNLLKIVTFGVLISISSFATAKEYFVFNGQQLEPFKSLYYYTKKLGTHDDEYSFKDEYDNLHTTKIWETENSDLRIAFDGDNFDSIYLDKEKDSSPDHIIINEQIVNFNDSINSIIQKFPDGCLFVAEDDIVSVSYHIPAKSPYHSVIFSYFHEYDKTIQQAKNEKIHLISQRIDDLSSDEAIECYGWLKDVK